MVEVVLLCKDSISNDCFPAVLTVDIHWSTDNSLSMEERVLQNVSVMLPHLELRAKLILPRAPLLKHCVRFLNPLHWEDLLFCLHLQLNSCKIFALLKLSPKQCSWREALQNRVGRILPGFLPYFSLTALGILYWPVCAVS